MIRQKVMLVRAGSDGKWFSASGPLEGDDEASQIDPKRLPTVPDLLSTGWRVVSVTSPTSWGYWETPETTTRWFGPRAAWLMVLEKDV